MMANNRKVETFGSDLHTIQNCEMKRFEIQKGDIQMYQLPFHKQGLATTHDYLL